MSPKSSTAHVKPPNVWRSRKTINGHKVQSFKPNNRTPSPTSEEKPHVAIGVIGRIDHRKTTLTAAIERILAQEENSAE